MPDMTSTDGPSANDNAATIASLRRRATRVLRLFYKKREKPEEIPELIEEAMSWVKALRAAGEGPA